MTPVDPETREVLAGISAAEAGMLDSVLELRDGRLEDTGLDERSIALVKVAVLIALDGPPASYAREVTNAIEAGATAEDILGVLRVVAPQVGGPRAVAAAPEIMLALGLSLEHDPEQSG